MTAAVTPAAPAKVIENLIEVRGLLSQFGDRVIHEGLDLTLERGEVLGVVGGSGTGKTVLAYEVAKALNAELITWHIKSTTKAHQGLYEYDAVTRLRDRP